MSRGSAPPREPWWRGAVMYQVYPASFADADGDGFGDLRGLASRLEHLAWLGVDGLWITPFYRSPLRDNGYDVSDYRDVDPRFGTLADFDALLARAHALGLKVLIDQVWSHTAQEHPWFEQSRASRDNPKADWYVWADAKPDGSPPNNWLSWFGGPAWRWEPRRRQYHLHNFLPEMPDLNFHCPAVQQAILDVARFWLDRGVDGFRLDTALLYFHDRQLRDNPPARVPGVNPVDMQEHLHDCVQPENLPWLERVRALLDGYDGRVAVAEIGGEESFPEMVEYTLSPHRLHTAYSFQLLYARKSAAFVGSAVADWTRGAAAAAWPSWSLSNHDTERVLTRWGGAAAGAHDAQLLLALLLGLRGTVFLYQGEELGLPQSDVPRERLRDPVGISGWPVHKGRDGCRTPMPWQAEAPNCGFGGGEPWLPIEPAHRALAVDRQQADPRSTLQLTRRLIALRREHAALRSGSFELLHAEGELLLVRRRAASSELLLGFNLGDAAAVLALPRPVREGLLALGGARAEGASLQLPARSAFYAGVAP